MDEFKAYPLPLDVFLPLEQLFNRLISYFEGELKQDRVSELSYICTGQDLADLTMNFLLAHCSKWASCVKPYSIPNKSEIDHHLIKSVHFNSGAVGSQM